MKTTFAAVLLALWSQPVHAAPVLGASGFGPFTVGMPLAAVNAHLNTKIVPTPPRLRANPVCDYVPVRDFPGVSFVFVDDRLARIDVARRGYRSADGVAVGDRQDEATRRLAGAKREPLDHVPAGVALVRESDGQPNALGYQFYGGRLRRMVAGGRRVIRYAEGCE
jgi:hypothetical protein